MPEPDPRLATVLDQIMQLAAGDMSVRGTITSRGDELDAIVAALNMLGEDMLERERARNSIETRNQRLSAYSRELERSNAALQELGYVASHDLQEPLRMITSYAALLEQRIGTKLDDEERSFLFYMTDGAKRMQELVRDLLIYSRVGGPTLAPTRVDTTLIVQGVLRDLRTAIQECAAEIALGTLPTIEVDPTQLGVVFRNLIANALKYRSEQTPRIEVSGELEADVALFCVRDNGIGIEAHHFERIFKLFQRLHGRDKFPGTGIGLALCRRIVEGHGGAIWVESEPSRGSAFRFSIPLSPRETQPG